MFYSMERKKSNKIRLVLAGGGTVGVRVGLDGNLYTIVRHWSR
jgi:hypothetical protein